MKWIEKFKKGKIIAPSMGEIVKFNPTKVDHLEQFIKDIDIGDIVKIYFERAFNWIFEYKWKPYFGESAHRRISRLIVAAEHLPDKYPDPRNHSSNMSERSHPNFAKSATALAGLVYYFHIGSKYWGGGSLSFIDAQDSQVYTTKRSMWLALGMNAPMRQSNLESIVEWPVSIPCVWIDVHCLGAYEKVVTGSIYPFEEETIKKIISCVGDMNSYEANVPEQQKLKLWQLAKEKREKFIKQVKEHPPKPSTIRSIL